MKSVVFVAVLAVTAPAMSAMASADSSAREQRVWERLSDQVSIALSYNDDPRLDAKVANVLRAMGSDGKGPSPIRSLRKRPGRPVPIRWPWSRKIGLIWCGSIRNI